MTSIVEKEVEKKKVGGWGGVGGEGVCVWRAEGGWGVRGAFERERKQIRYMRFYH